MATTLVIGCGIIGMGVLAASARKPVIVHAIFAVEEMQMIVERVPPEGLCVTGRAETPDEARRLRDGLLD